MLVILVSWRGCFIAASWSEIDSMALMNLVTGLDGSFTVVEFAVN